MNRVSDHLLAGLPQRVAAISGHVLSVAVRDVVLELQERRAADPVVRDNTWAAKQLAIGCVIRTANKGCNHTFETSAKYPGLIERCNSVDCTVIHYLDNLDSPEFIGALWELA